MSMKNANVIIPSSDDADLSSVTALANIMLVFFCVGVFIVAFIAAAKVLLPILVETKDKPQIPIDVVFAQFISLGLLFFMGWASSLVSIYIFKNKRVPYILLACGFIVSCGMAVVYSKGIYKCFLQDSLGWWKYALVLAAGYCALVAFSLLTDKVDLRFMVAPLVSALACHIFLLVFHYVFNIFSLELNTDFMLTDLGLIAVIVILLGLMANRRNYLALQLAMRILIRALPSLPSNKALPGERI